MAPTAAGRRVIDAFRFCLPIWGEDFVRTWLDVALPTQLAPGNLEDFPWASGSTIEIYTRRQDTALMEASPAFGRLKRAMKVEVIDIDHLFQKSVFGIYTECQRMAIRAADAADATLSFLSPDMVMSPGTLKNAALRIRAGATAYVIPGNRTVKEDMVPWLLAHGSDGGSVIAVPARDLVRRSIDCMHANSESWFWNSKRFDRTPAYLMWEVPGAGLVAYCYVLHPMMLRAEIRGAELANIFDQDYLERACPTVERIHVAHDSDEAFIFGLDPRDRFKDHLIEYRASPYDLAYWAEWAFNPHHRRFAATPIRHRYADGDPEAWKTAEQAGRAVVDDIAALLAVPDWQLALLDRKRLLMRLRRRYRYLHKELHNVGFVWSVIDSLPSLRKQLHHFVGRTSAADMAALEWYADEEDRPSIALTDRVEMAERYRRTMNVVEKLRAANQGASKES
jgi:hypothetical protein